MPSHSLSLTISRTNLPKLLEFLVANLDSIQELIIQPDHTWVYFRLSMEPLTLERMWPTLEEYFSPVDGNPGPNVGDFK